MNNDSESVKKRESLWMLSNIHSYIYSYIFVRKSIHSFGNASLRKQDLAYKQIHRLKQCCTLPVMSESLEQHGQTYLPKIYLQITPYLKCLWFFILPWGNEHSQQFNIHHPPPPLHNKIGQNDPVTWQIMWWCACTITFHGLFLEIFLNIYSVDMHIECGPNVNVVWWVYNFFIKCWYSTIRCPFLMTSLPETWGSSRRWCACFVKSAEPM